MYRTTELLGRWDKGDEDAFGELVKKHLPWIDQQARRKLGQKLRARFQTGDVVSNALLSLLRSMPKQIPKNGDQFRRLLLRIVVRQIQTMALLKDVLGDEELQADQIIDSVTPSENAALRETQARADLALRFLSAEERLLVELRDVRELPWRKIGELLGMDGASLQVRYGRIRKRLLELMEWLRSQPIEDVLDRLDAMDPLEPDPKDEPGDEDPNSSTGNEAGAD